MLAYPPRNSCPNRPEWPELPSVSGAMLLVLIVGCDILVSNIERLVRGRHSTESETGYQSKEAVGVCAAVLTGWESERPLLSTSGGRAKSFRCGNKPTAMEHATLALP